MVAVPDALCVQIYDRLEYTLRTVTFPRVDSFVEEVLMSMSKCRGVHLVLGLVDRVRVRVSRRGARLVTISVKLYGSGKISISLAC